MRKNRLFFIALGIIFFLASLTFYLNRMVFPVQFKKFAIAQAEGFLKRKVEIEALHFNWVRGLIVDKIKIYQKGSSQVFVQARQVSFGIVFIPGFKQHRITIPFINIKDPSVHLIRAQDGQWNFSDLLTAPAPQEKPSPFSVTVAGVRISDGKLRVDDLSGPKGWTQLIDNVDLRAGLSYNGISFDFSAAIPQQQGMVMASGAFQPIGNSVQAQVRAKNIRPAEYLALIPPIQGFELKNALVEDLDMQVNYARDSMGAKGDVTVKDIDARANGHTVKGNLRTHISRFELAGDSMDAEADLALQNAAVGLASGEAIKGAVTIEKLKARRDKDGIKAAGTLTAKGLDVRRGEMSASGDLTIPLNIVVKTANGKQAIDLNGKASIDNLRAFLSPDISLMGNISLPSLVLGFVDDTVTVKTEGNLSNGQISLGEGRAVTASPSFTASAVYPVKDPAKLRYGGSFAVHKAQARGFPFSPFTDIELDGEFQTNQMDIKSFALVAMDAPVKGTAAIMDFKNPVVNVEATCEKMDLAKLNGMLQQYGVETSGEASFNVQFEGMASDPLGGKIKARMDLRGVNVASSKLNQSVSNISGTVEGTPDVLSWNNFTGTYLGKSYTLNGGLTDFKNPKITTSLDGDDVKLKADLKKSGDVLTIKELKGRYLKVSFDANGTVGLPEGGEPNLDINARASLDLSDTSAFLPPEYRKVLDALKASGAVNVSATVKGRGLDWKKWTSTAKLESSSASVMGYTLTGISAAITQHDGKVSHMTADAMAYDGKVHAVGSGDLTDAAMPFELALNVDGLNLHKFKMDVPQLRSEELNGKFYLTAVGSGKLADVKNLQAKGSLAIREGFLTEFKLFKGLLGVLNEVLKIGQVMITDVEGNFTVANQKVTTDNLRLKSPTIVLVTDGWVGFDQNCDLNVTVDMSSGIVPPVAQDVLRSLKIRVYDNILNPKYDKKISVPQVINSIIKTIGIFQ